MANAVIVQTRVQASDIDALNRSAKGATAFPNGTPLALAFPSTAGSAVFTATKAGAGATDVYLAYSPEVNKAVVGATYGGLDPRNFTNLANKTFDTFKPVKGDIIQVSTDFFYATKDPATVSGATVVELTANGFEAKVSATGGYTGLGFKIGRKENITIAQGTVLAEGIDAWLLEVTSV